MTIHYELGAHWLCITPCPHGMKSEDGKQNPATNGLYLRELDDDIQSDFEIVREEDD